MASENAAAASASAAPLRDTDSHAEWDTLSDAALVAAADAASEAHAQRKASGADPVERLSLESAQIILEKNPWYYANHDPEDLDVVVEKMKGGGKPGGAVRADAYHIRVVSRKHPSVYLVRFYTPAFEAQFARMWPFGNRKTDYPKDDYGKHDVRECTFSVNCNLNETEELEKFKDWLARASTRIMTKVLTHPEAGKTMRDRAAADMAGEWAMTCKLLKHELKEREENTLTDEEKSILHARGNEVPPIPVSRLVEKVMRSYMTPVIKLRKEKATKQPMPGTESTSFTRPVFHVPNATEAATLDKRIANKKPLLSEEDREFLGSTFDTVLQAMTTADRASLKLYTDVPLIDVMTGESVVCVDDRSVKDRDRIAVAFYFRPFGSSPKDTCSAPCTLDSVLHFGAAPADTAQARAMDMWNQPEALAHDLAKVANMRKRRADTLEEGAAKAARSEAGDE